MIITWAGVKPIFAILSLITTLWAVLPYLRDIFLKKTKPHAYTWLIWTITQGTAAAGLIYGKGGWGGLELVVGTALVFIIFLLSLKYGTRSITKSDTVVLIFALLAIVIWWQLHNPFLAVIMVSAIDFAGYIPSFRKTFYEPWTETPSSWAIFSLGNILNILALSQYNFLTLTYLITIIIANAVLLAVCLIRRQVVLPDAPTK
ncbi:MAG: hypothetical protein M1361_01130 [Patescibacteria group bacterium]|nr:hypothetical protein [Patescibacteria group bacterium]MCL5224206.1 hypothetical protein [Patescibacteria group bacterium]